KTTQSHHRFYRHPNLLKAGDNQVIASRPEQVWVADITYLPLVHHSDRGIQWLITSCRSANNIMPITFFLPAFIASSFYSA
ncbi:hypothetical protein ACUNDO_09745, partial [Serratia sp. IR-2025]